MSEQNEIFKALAEAQAEMKNPALDSVNPHFKSKFANLASVRNAVIPVLAKHGLFLAQDLTNTERGIACKTIISHVSGQQITFGPLEMPAMKPDAQGLGSAATYARRYSLMAALSIVGDEDDDANAASKANGKDTHISPEQEKKLSLMIDEVGADRLRFLQAMHVDRLSDLPAKDYQKAVNALEDKRRAAARAQ